jgi:outer membrane cobalamin receptor
LYSQAFRSPAVENLNLTQGNKVVPEKSDVGELELGYQFTPEMLLSVNAFVLNTRNVITYQYAADGTEYYQNFPHTGSRGLEVVYSIRKKRWNANVNYSFAQAAQNSSVLDYRVPQTTTQFVGMPAHKAVGMINYSLTGKLSLNATLIYSGKRYAYSSYDALGNPVSKPLDPYVLANSFLNYESNGFILGAGVYDLFDQRPAIPQAYNGSNGPIPGRSREFVIKVAYQLNFKK